MSGDNRVIPGVQFQAELRLSPDKHFKGSVHPHYKIKKNSQFTLVVMQIVLVVFAMVLRNRQRKRDIVFAVTYCC